MVAATPKITLSRSMDIPFNKLVLSQSNVRRLKAGISVEELAEDIARRTLLQSLNVRPVRDAGGAETGMYEVPAGGRRFRALELLVKQKRMNKTQPVPCVVREDGSAEEDSLAENVQRVALHPLDQFRAFQTLRDQGLGDEEIAARFFVTPAVVKQRLRLASVSPRLLAVYGEDGMTLEQLMAFTVTGDHARQERAWDSLNQSYATSPYSIRRQLTEGAVSSSDRRALFVGAEAYEAAGGVIVRDLFDEDGEGWLQDAALLDRLVTEKLAREAEALRGEGWKWIRAAAEFPYGHTSGLRRLRGEEVPQSAEEQATCDALTAEYQRLEETYANADEYPEEVDQRLGEIETLIGRMDDRPVTYEPADIARAGIFVSIDDEGRVEIERGFLRKEDCGPEGSDADQDSDPSDDDAEDGGDNSGTVITIGAEDANAEESDEQGDGIKPLPDRLVTELTAHRTLALRDALARDPGTAFLAVLHSLVLGAFYHLPHASCLEVSAKSIGFGIQGPDLKDCMSAKAIEEREAEWTKRLPEDAKDLWSVLGGFDESTRTALFAHCAALSVNALREPWNRNAARDVHVAQLARSVHLDMTAAGWSPTVETYLGKVTKARILETVREAKGEAAAQLIDHLKKPEMAREAERLLSGSGWLPEPLRVLEEDASDEASSGVSLPAFLTEPEHDDVEPETLAAE